MAGQSSFIVLAKDYGPEAGLAMLAAFSLYMVFRIAKRAQATVALSGTAAATLEGSTPLGGRPVGAGGKAPLPPLGGGPETVGEAQGLEGLMLGREVDEGMVRTQNMVQQIGQFVQDDAAAPAAILENWIEADD